MAMTPRNVPAVRGRRLTILVLVAIAAAAAFYWMHEPSCRMDARGLRGEVKYDIDGQPRYFDGRCWSSTPVPPMDTPM
jgi:hypothetical protein